MDELEFISSVVLGCSLSLSFPCCLMEGVLTKILVKRNESYQKPQEPTMLPELGLHNGHILIELCE